MRVLVTGAGGKVGTELRQRVPAWVELTALNSGELDISDASAVERCVTDLRPQLLINAAAYTAVDRAETEEDKAYAVNARGAENLARSAQVAGIPLFHISTDYVFNGDSSAAYLEQATTDPQTVYGRSKLAGEQSVATLCPRHVILRTSWVFSAHGGNFVKTMLRLAAERDELRVVADQYGGPTSAASIAACLWKMADEYRSKQEGFNWGLFHFSGAPQTSWHGFADHIIAAAATAGLIQRSPQVQPITSAEFPTPAPRPAFSVLNCEKIREQHGIEQPDWRGDVLVVLAELGKA